MHDGGANRYDIIVLVADSLCIHLSKTMKEDNVNINVTKEWINKSDDCSILYEEILT
jgi:hypothetical protein